MSKKLWVFGYLIIIITLLSFIAAEIIFVDPFFHYHAPDTGRYFYPLDNQRSQNNGIVKNFKYQGIITGTSMTENFKTSEAERLFGVTFVKVPYAGSTFNEINRNLMAAASHNPDLKYIIRSLDMAKYIEEPDSWRKDLGSYPFYLYDDCWINDAEYVFNRDVLFSRVYPMIKEKDMPDFKSGITSFDDYSSWMKGYSFGQESALKNTPAAEEPAEHDGLTPEETDIIKTNIQLNVTALAKQYPGITFYYFLTPYSAAWWQILLREERLDKQVDAEKIVIEEILEVPNIKLFSLNCLFDVTTDLNNYKDERHYGEWINSLVLRYIYDGKCLLTKENYLDYLEAERRFYKNYDYAQLAKQEDYENDTYAAALLNREITGTEPLHIDFENNDSVEIMNAVLEDEPDTDRKILICRGRLNRPSHTGGSLSNYLRDSEYIGAKIQIDDVSPYDYLVINGKKAADHGQLTARLYDKKGSRLAKLDTNYSDLDKEWHRYIIDVSNFDGPCTLILNGGYTDDTGREGSEYWFGDVTLF